MTPQLFQELIWEQGKHLYRSMPWREKPDPYYVLVSELMLQQTQVSRVIPKFEAFIRRFPTIESLAESSLADVLVMWSGLGYNRRAKYLWLSAQATMAEFNGVLPRTQKELVSLPGVGPNTAAAILNYAYEIATPFVETNIRTVYFHHFFHDQTDISDKTLLRRVAETIDKEQPREWFWALMDYGVYLKAARGGQLDKSKHYKKQSQLAGSLREMRGRIIRALTINPLDENELRRIVDADDRFGSALTSLQRDALVEYDHDRWRLYSDRR